CVPAPGIAAFLVRVTRRSVPIPHPARRMFVDGQMSITTSRQAQCSTTQAWRVIAFGFIATFMSSFGQTFFVGLFSPRLGAAADVEGTTVSLLYGIATLTSGSLLFWLGGAMDRLRLRSAVTVTVLILSMGSLLVVGVQTSIMLLIAFF